MSNLIEQVTEAIAAHAAWKTKFKKYLNGDLELDPSVVRRCDLCDFGKWLAGAGHALLGRNFGAIDAAHKHFHEVAANVVDLHRTGKTQQAIADVGLTGSFTRAGAALTRLLVTVRDKAT